MLLVVYLVLLELPINQQCGLFVHFFSDSMSYGIVGLQASVETGIAVLIVHILLGMSRGRRGEKNTLRLVGWTKNSNDKNWLSTKLRRSVLLNDVPDIHFRHVFTVRVRDLLLLLGLS